MKRSPLTQTVNLVSCVLFICIILMLTVFQPQLRQYYDTGFPLTDNLPLFGLALVLIALCFVLRRTVLPGDAQREKLLRLRLIFVGIFLVQIVIVRCVWYRISWDAGAVHHAAEALSAGEALPERYFDLCPNNTPIALVMTGILWLGRKVGMAVPYVLLPYTDALLMNLSAYLAVRCVQKLTGSRFARVFAGVLATGWIALSPFLMFPYTDTFAILFPVAALYAYLSIRRRALRWFTVSLLAFLGYCMKPSALIVLIALLLLGFFHFLGQKNFSRQRWIAGVCVVLAVIAGALPGLCFQRLSLYLLCGSVQPQGQLCETHYLMLGMNDDSSGGHSDDDVAFSLSFPTVAERRRANLSKAWERLTSRNLRENLRFFIGKLYKGYADGSFAAHSSFLDESIPRRTDTLSTLLRSLYHHRGSGMRMCHTIAQCVWMGVLTLCAAACWIHRHSHPVCVMSLSLLGLTLYLLLFEVWPRYLFLYAPFYVILAALCFAPAKAVSGKEN